MAEERLQKVLARAGVASRRRSEDLIVSGRVRVNGAVVRALGSKVDPERDRITVDGNAVGPPAAPRVAMLNKPAGVISAARDPRGRTTVVDLVPDTPRLYPVGRLDYDSEGLILLTNDGDLAFALTHPRHGVPKTYHVWAEGEPSARVVERLARGVELDGRRTAPAGVRVLGPEAPGRLTRLEIVLREGRNRQIRRMCQAVGHPVHRLVRVAIGTLELGGLPPGSWRWLTPEETRRLREEAADGPRDPHA